VTRRLLALLAVEPVLIWFLLALPWTHRLVRWYPDSEAGKELPVVAVGPMFWVHLAYSNVVLLVATVMLLVTAARLARVYRVRAATLVLSALLPWAANLLHNFEVGPFRPVDFTPVAFVLTGGVLVLGLYQPRPGGLSSVAWTQVVRTVGLGILLVDGYSRVTDANPAAQRLLGRSDADVFGVRLDDLLTELRASGRIRNLEITREPLLDAADSPEGELVTLRDVSESLEEREHLEQQLAERTRVATALADSLRPARLPHVPGVELASRYRPAGDGDEIGGDFFDVFPLDEGRWGVVLGDVSGKGSHAASLTALIRYTLRAYATVHADRGDGPALVLERLNEALLHSLPEERFCTLVFAVAEVHDHRVHLRLCLAGHHPGLLRRTDGRALPVGVPGTVLGLVENVDLADAEVVLEPGDLLCLFTDGVLDARRGDELFGAERATAVVARSQGPRCAVAGLADAVQAFQRGPLPDDLAILALGCEVSPDRALASSAPPCAAHPAHSGAPRPGSSPG
jgi:serine phosphatase RsbU (regulator of sigma subunit)